MMPAFARRWLLKREIDRNLRQRRMARIVRSQAAQQGHSNHIKRLAAQTREMFS